MECEKLLKADYLDIIFDHRNKAYGGYELRKNYSRRTRNASSFVLFAAAIGFAIPALAGILKKPEAIITRPHTTGPIILHPVADPVKPIKPVITPPAQPKQIASVKITPPVITSNNLVRPEDVIPPNASIHDRQISNTNQVGDVATSDISLPSNPDPNGTGTGGIDVVDAGGGKPGKPFTVVEQMPTFNGDIMAYLSSHTQYPEPAKEGNIQGRVVVQFVVNEDGSVSNAEVVRSASPLLDREALRVISSMPRWKAGKQNGNAVKVFFSLPITFTLE